MRPFDWRTFVVWDVTYACPLRCIHCYSESGRRASRMLDEASFLRGIDALIEAKIQVVAFSGGEPTLHPALLPAARRLRDAGIKANIFTSGFGINRVLADELVGALRRIHVSIDGATPATHDQIRGRDGSFAQAFEALALLVNAARNKRTRIGVDISVVRSNLHEVGTLCRLLAEQFPSLNFINIGAAIPSGVATTRSVVQREILDDAAFDTLRSAAFREDVSRGLSPKTAVEIADNWHLLPVDLSRIPIQVEPDGRVRAFPIYEGTIGNILEEPLARIWERARERHADAAVVALLTGVRTVDDWGVAARSMDQRFGSGSDLARIRRREVLV